MNFGCRLSRARVRPISAAGLRKGDSKAQPRSRLRVHSAELVAHVPRRACRQRLASKRAQPTDTGPLRPSASATPASLQTMSKGAPNPERTFIRRKKRGV